MKNLSLRLILSSTLAFLSAMQSAQLSAMFPAEDYPEPTQVKFSDALQRAQAILNEPAQTDDGKQKAVVFDIDNTLVTVKFDVASRLEAVAKLLQLAQENGFRVCLITSRYEKFREKTKLQLAAVGIDEPYELFMFPNFEPQDPYDQPWRDERGAKSLVKTETRRNIAVDTPIVLTVDDDQDNLVVVGEEITDAAGNAVIISTTAPSQRPELRDQIGYAIRVPGISQFKYEVDADNPFKLGERVTGQQDLTGDQDPDDIDAGFGGGFGGGF